MLKFASGGVHSHRVLSRNVTVTRVHCVCVDDDQQCSATFLLISFNNALLGHISIESVSIFVSCIQWCVRLATITDVSSNPMLKNGIS